MNGAPVLSVAVHHPASSFVGGQITALVRVSAGLVVLQLADGSQLHFTARGGELEVGVTRGDAH